MASMTALVRDPIVEDEVPEWMAEEWLWSRPSPEMLRYLELDLPIGKPARWPAFAWE